MPTKKPTKNRGSKSSHNARAVVTGAGSGIGRAFSLELARRGGEVNLRGYLAGTGQGNSGTHR